jgi:very-short-patch-repair endonuclease
VRGKDEKRADQARSLRFLPTRAESLLWNRLRNRQFYGFKFVRQEPIGRYYVDFVCRERRLIVEVDGGQHAESSLDRRRDRDLSGLGYRVIRFWNSEVLSNIEGVLQTLLIELRRQPLTLPSPRKRGEGEGPWDDPGRQLSRD